MRDTDEYVKSQLLINREAFRAKNVERLRMFTVADRNLCRDLDTISVPFNEFLQIFRDQVAPTIKMLETKHSSKTIRTYLMKNLGLGGLSMDLAANYLIAARRNQIITDFIAKIGGQSNENRLRNLLNRPIDELLDLFERYHDYRQALDISEQYGLALVDPRASWLKRRRMQKSAKRDQRQIARRERESLRQIERRIANLFNENRLLADTVDKNWSLVEVLSLYHQYQKCLDKAKDSSPSTKIEIFEEVTSEFRRNNIETLAAGNDKLSLKELRALGANVYNLLLEVFDMDNTGRNRLVVGLRTYSELINEREQLLIARRNREDFLGLNPWF